MRDKISEHLDAGCDRCEEELQWIRDVVGALSDDPSEIHPDTLKIAADRIFRDYQRRKDETDVSVVHGILVYDSSWVPVPAGVRSPGLGQRRLLYTADPFQIDLEVSPVHHGRFDVLGQVLSDELLPPESSVALHVRPLVHRPLDTTGMFRFDSIAPGLKRMTVSVGGRTVELSHIHIG